MNEYPAPNVLYLQKCDGFATCTWSEERMHPTDIEYRRAIPELTAMIEAWEKSIRAHLAWLEEDCPHTNTPAYFQMLADMLEVDARTTEWKEATGRAKGRHGEG